jgi:CHAD domain-containing protein
MDRVVAYLALQGSALLAGEAALHAGDRSAVHKARVGARRARSTLRTFGAWFSPVERDRAVATLRDYAARLAPVRDLQVLRDVLAAHASGELADWALMELDAQIEAAWPFAARTVRLAPATWLGALPPGPRPETLTEEACFARAADKVRRRLARAGDDPELLHETRKAAKRARYAAEALGLTDEAARFEAVQEALGAHRDLVIAADWVESFAPPPLDAAAAELGARLRRDAADVRRRAVL